MISRYDWLDIVFYVAFIVSIGLYFVRKNKNTSDYFRGGGVVPWWVTGASAWMASFSAWTFTGAAGKIYKEGTYVLCLYYSALFALALLFGFTCYRFRRMRVVTPLEAVRLRFGAVSQGFYTWVRVPIMLLFGGVSLNSVGVFMAALFGVDVSGVLAVLGCVITLVALLGGSFGIAANDFVQMFLLVTVTLVVSVLALAQPGIGGFPGLLAKAPAADFHWGEVARPGILLFWFGALAINNVFSQNSMEMSAKYLMTQSDRHARLMVVIPLVGTLLGPLIWFIPPMAASITDPNAAALFPNLKYPEEGAFLITAHRVLPQGMLGLLICGIFAATVTSMDASLNQGVGTFVRNFYLPVVNPRCSEKKLLVLSKVTTAVFGAIIVGIAVKVNEFRNLGLFDLLNQLGLSLMLPLAIPLALGLYVKRTPSWSTWSTVLIGLATSFSIHLAYTEGGNPGAFVLFRLLHGIGGGLAGAVGLVAPYTPTELPVIENFLTVFAILAVGVPWFFFTALFYDRASASYKADVEAFFVRLREPLRVTEGAEVRENRSVARSISRLCLIYGLFVVALALIPNPPRGRICFLAVGGTMAAVGLFLNLHYGRAAEARPEPGTGKEGKETSPSVSA
ncbi:MAG TPA: hypothetical protein VIM58_12195 [Candidatus Methylacidiphilales bacterium]